MQSLTRCVAVLCCVLLGSTPLMAQMFEPAGSVVAVDANGTTVGPAVLHRDHRDGYEVSVMLQRGEQVFYLGMWSEDWLDSEDMVGFAAADCTGDPFLVASFGPPSLFSMAGIAAPGATLYLPESGSVPQEFQMQSVLGRLGCIPIPATPALGTPAEAVVDLETLFAPPFHLAPASAGLPQIGRAPFPVPPDTPSKAAKKAAKAKKAKKAAKAAKTAR